jgi:hypothetical protein
MRYYALFLALITANVFAAESHCTNQEQTIFSCGLAKSSKVISLCSSTKLAKGQGALAYRFGPLGKVELEFPSSSTNSLQQFRHSHYSRFQTDRTEVSFSIGKYDYSVFDYYDGDEKPKESRGVRVGSTGGKGKETVLLCGGAVKSELQKLEGVIPCDTDSALATCN